ncbi:multidrug ABC transporter ATP-binding protein [Phytohabitans rumicis]|uniref:Multidrug ABC transporter ATP-binding protein n=2 Tax=Phytohabitans rumicis TaxID=1076125 RepID=A0A6V8LCS0_9ACTN|nr:multidrug ABC transporter ATP-binding protein [Phytohabitans rumicis]
MRTQWSTWLARLFVVGGLAAGAAAAGRVVVAIVVELVVDHRVPLGAAGSLAASVMLVLAAGGATAYLLSVRLSEWTERKLAAVRDRTLSAVRALTPAQVRQHRRALLDRLAAEVDGVSCYVRWDNYALPAAVVQVLFTTIAMLVYSPLITIATYAGLAPLVVGARLVERRLANARTRATAKDEQLAVVSRAVLLTAPMHRAAAARRAAEQRIDEALRARDEAAVAAVRASAALTGLREFSVAVAVALAVGTGLALSIEGRLEIGRAIAVALLAVTLVHPAQAIAGAIGEARQAADGLRRLDAPLPGVRDPGADGVALPPGPVGIRFESVCCDTGGGRRLAEVDLDIPAGRLMAFVGTPGAGHPAVADLLTRIADPDAGRVLLGGVPLTRVPFASLRPRVLSLPRNGFVIAGTVADNIRLGLPGVTDAQVAGACADLGLTGWLDELDRGMHTLVGRGRDRHTLSAAEQYLVALAHAYLYRPDVMVVTDCTDDDPVLRARIDQAFAVVARGRTTILITHRPAAARAADEVAVFANGRLVERGTYARLSADPDSAYARLHLPGPSVARH